MPNFIKFYEDKDVARKMRNEYRKKNYKLTQGNNRRPWNKEEDNYVLNSKFSDRELASKIARSVESIQIRRCRLKKELKLDSE